jgi:hypothetical protein
MAGWAVFALLCSRCADTRRRVGGVGKVGVVPVSVAYPFNSSNAAVRDAGLAAGYTGARTQVRFCRYRVSPYRRVKIQGRAEGENTSPLYNC